MLIAAGSKIPSGFVNSKGRKIFKRKQKVLSALCQSRTHVLICNKVEDGGYKFVRYENGKVHFSIWTMRAYWPNWLKEMNEGDMNMRACETCQTMDDTHVAYVAKCSKMITRDKARLEELTGSTRAVA